MKKVITIILLAGILCGLCACGQNTVKEIAMKELVNDDYYCISGSVIKRDQDNIIVHFLVENKTGLEMWVRSDQLIYYVVVDGIKDEEIWRNSSKTCVHSNADTMKENAEFEVRIGMDFFNKYNLSSDAIQKIEFDFHPFPYDKEYGSWKTMSTDEYDEYVKEYGRHIVFELLGDEPAENAD